MKSPTENWTSRLAGLALGLAGGGYLILEAIKTSSGSLFISAAGIVLYGVIWFFQPVQFTSSVRENVEGRIHRSKLLKLLSTIALILVIVGFALRFLPKA